LKSTPTIVVTKENKLAASKFNFQNKRDGKRKKFVLYESRALFSKFFSVQSFAWIFYENFGKE
jgi:hypothetical protein